MIIEEATAFEVTDTLTSKTFRVTYGNGRTSMTSEVTAVNMFKAIDIIERTLIEGARVIEVKELRPKFMKRPK